MSPELVVGGPLWLALALPLFLLAMTVKEYGHAWMATRLGDESAKKSGRLSLLPFVHFEWLGCLVMPLLLSLGPWPTVLGYGKPVPVDPARFKHPQRDFSIVAAAGPLANVLMALLLSLGGFLLQRGLMPEATEPGAILGLAVQINLALACLHALPLPGFPGVKLLYAFLPEAWCWNLQSGERYFLIILVLAAGFGVLNMALQPGAWLAEQLCRWAGLPIRP